MSFLVLIGGDDVNAPMAWARADGGGEVSERGQPGQTPPAAAPARTILILPGAEARVRRLETEARTEAQARAAAQYLFEGALAGQQEMHYAAGPAHADGARLVAAMAAPRLQLWLDRCRDLGADPHLVLLDCTAWPAEKSEVVIAPFSNRVIVAGGEAGGFSIEPELAGPLAARWLSEINPQRIVLRGGDANTWRAALGGLGARLQSEPAADPVAELVRGAIDTASAPNLRQGAFATEQRDGQPWKMWRFAALLAAAAFLLQIGSLLISGWRDQQAATRTLANAEREFKALRPDVTRIVNLRAQVSAIVNRLEQAGRHPVLAASAPVIEALHAQPLARIDDVRHDGAGRQVRMQVSASDQVALEALIGDLRARGLATDSRELPPREGRYAAEIVLEAPP